jgi:PIN domain nuclease of toxin-antitoxin system
MNAVLLDTHVLLWWLQGGSNLSSQARTIVSDPATKALVSAASAWEIAIKFKAGKLDAGGLVARFHSILEVNRFLELPVSATHAIKAGLLEGSHRDPFDRMLVAQAQIENVPIVSNDKMFDRFSVRRLW